MLFSSCRDHNITLSKEKFQIGPSVKFAGHIVSADGIKPDPEKVEALKLFPRPQTVTDVRSFLGLANQLGSFVPDLTHVCRPLHELTKKNTAFVWGPAQEEAFSNAKDILTSDLLVKTFNPALKTEVYTDASRIGLGYLLCQRDEKNELRLIKCGSRALTPAEKNYSVTELECLGVYFAVSSSEFYLAGAPSFDVITDHRALEGLWSKQLADVSNPRLLRYRERLQQYGINIVWQAGKTHHMADALSRAPYLPGLANEDSEDSVDKAHVLHTLTELSKRDPNLDKMIEDIDDDYNLLIESVKHGRPPEELSHYSNVFDELSLTGNFVFLGQRLVVPKPARKRILRALHAGHCGFDKTLALAKSIVYWPELSNHIRTVCDSCVQCRANRPAQQRDGANRPLARSTDDLYPMSDVGIDLFSYGGKDYLVHVDRWSGFPFVYRLSSTSTRSVTDQLLRWWSLEGLPRRVRTDGGPQFQRPFREFLEKYGIVHELASAYNPESNGLAESAVKQVKTLLKKCHDEGSSFDEALLVWRSTPKANGPSPATLFRHRDLRLPGLPQAEASLRFKTTSQMQQYASQRQKQLDATLDRVDKRGRDCPDELLEVGTRVDIKDPQGPGWLLDAATIIDIRDDQRSYVLQDARSGRQFVRNKKMIRAAVEFQQHPSVSALVAADSILKTGPSQRTSRPNRIRFRVEEGGEEKIFDRYADQVWHELRAGHLLACVLETPLQHDSYAAAAGSGSGPPSLVPMDHKNVSSAQTINTNPPQALQPPRSKPSSGCTVRGTVSRSSNQRPSFNGSTAGSLRARPPRSRFAQREAAGR